MYNANKDHSLYSLVYKRCVCFKMEKKKEYGKKKWIAPSSGKFELGYTKFHLKWTDS